MQNLAGNYSLYYLVSLLELMLNGIKIIKLLILLLSLYIYINLYIFMYQIINSFFLFKSVLKQLSASKYVIRIKYRMRNFKCFKTKSQNELKRKVNQMDGKIMVFHDENFTSM